MPQVAIQGEGIAAACCATLLRRQGVEVAMAGQGRPQVPAIMLSDAAVALIRDVLYEGSGDDGRFQELPRITRRFVLWGAEAQPLELEHSAVVISEAMLLAGLAGPDDVSIAGTSADWKVLASRPLPENTMEHRFGNRTAAAVAVGLQRNAPENACWVESLAAGWLFLITTAPGIGWLIAVGGEAEEMLGCSRMTGDAIESLNSAPARFPCAPRMLSPVGGPGWLACGSAALGFDPLCGDGTAHAVREAILASAVIRAALGGCDAGSLVHHYQARLTAGFGKHLELCLRFYESGGDGAWWREQAAAIREGIVWCSGQPQRRDAYRLRGFELEPVS